MRDHPRFTGTLLVLALPLLLGVDLLQSKNRATEAGNARLSAGKAEEALGEYDKAAEKLPNDPGVQFNRGVALYSLSRFDEATEAFLRATEAKTPDRKAQAFYNLGNTHFQAKRWKESVAAFKKSLAYDPANPRAKWNLELAMRQKQDEEKNQDKKQDDKKKDGKENPESKEQAKNESKKDDKGGGSGKDKGDKQNEKPPEKPQPPENDKQAGRDPAKQDEKQPPGAGQKPDPAQEKDPQQAQAGPDPREVEAILDNLEKSPKSLEQELARLRAAHRRPPAKDW